MNDSRFPVPGHENEKIIIFTRRHIISMLGPILMVLVMVLFPILIVTMIYSTNRDAFSGILLNFLVIGGSIYYLVVVTFAFIEWISYYYDIFIVTEDEIIDINQEGIFDRRITEVTLLRVQDVSAHVRGFWATLFSYGDVVAESAGENTKTYIIDSIPNPFAVAKKILALHNEHIARQASVADVATGEGEMRAIKPCPPVQSQSEFQQAVQRDMQTAQGAPPQVSAPAPVCPPCPPVNPPAVQPPPQPITQGEIKDNDLKQGGEVKF